MHFEVIREFEAWPEESVLEGYCARVMDALADTLEDGSHINYAFASDAEIKALNRDFREKDKPTNVLSFPDGDEMPDGTILLGDIMLAHETVAREAEAEGKAFEDHVVHLMLHGALHLMGYDHITEDEAAEMEALEIQLLAKIGVKNPYED